MTGSLDAPLVDDFSRYMREMATLWERFMTTGQVPETAIRRTIANSWRRCRERGIDPLSFKAPTQHPDRSEVDESLLEVAPAAVQGLSGGLQLTRHLIAVCDARGRILDVAGDREVIARAMDVNIARGGVWAEDLVGTNGIGTSLQEGRPVQIFATEHFCAGWQDWTCSAAPIRDPHSGAILGGVNISSYRAPAHPHTLEFTAAIAREIEKELYTRGLVRRAALLEAFGLHTAAHPAGAVVAVDRDGQVVAATPAARRLLEASPRATLMAACAEAARAALRGPGRLERDLPGPEGRRLASDWHPVHASGVAAGAIGVLGLPGCGGRARTAPPGPELAAWAAWEGAPTRSPRLWEALDLARRTARTELPVLVLGESGTGKELVARAIHRGSRRAGGPFVAVNCGALAPELVVSELFGYEAGAFTGAARSGSPGKFEQAHGGTLFLDEVGDLPLQAQVALLRALEAGEITRVGGRQPRRVDVRVVAATNRDLQAAVRTGSFREDLYFRLNALELVLPPLRERPEDIPLLVQHFLAQAGHSRVTVSAEALAILHRYHWPGNVRELRNVIHRALMLQEGGRIEPGHLHPRLTAPAPGPAGGWDEQKRQAVLAALEQAGGNVAAAARRLGVSRGTIYRYLNRG